MSQTLPAVSLASVSLGQTGIVNLTNVGPDANPSYTKKPPHLLIHNESGVGLLISFQTGGDSFFLPAGGWVPVPLTPGENALVWQVQYILNVVGGAPVSQLLVTYYGPNEPVPAVAQLGNSPIGGAVNTSSIQTLSQEGQPKQLLTIDIGDSVLSNLWNIFNDGTATFKVDVAGVAHTILAIANAANFLQLGQAGDIAEVLGTLRVDNIIDTRIVGVSGNGSVAGSAIAYEFLTGNVKFVLVTELGLNTASNVDLLLPSGFTNNGFIITGTVGVSGSGGVQLMSGGSPININVITGLAAAGGSTAVNAPASIFSASIGYTNGAFDTIRFVGTGGTTRTAPIIIIGN